MDFVAVLKTLVYVRHLFSALVLSLGEMLKRWERVVVFMAFYPHWGALGFSAVEKFVKKSVKSTQ